MKYVIAVGDGMADERIESLGGKTPVEFAHTPHMDAIATEGVCQLVDLVPEGYPPGSDIGNMSILGYAPDKYHTGRSPIEAASLGVELAPTEVSFRANTVTLEDGKMKSYSAGHIETEDSVAIIKELSVLNCDKYRFYPGIQYRHLLVVEDIDISDTYTPPHDLSGDSVEAHLPVHPVVREIFEKSAEILANSPTNKKRLAAGKLPVTHIWPWGEGTSPSYPTLKERYGLTGAVISAVDLVKGLGVLAKMEVVEVEGATGYLDTNYAGKVEACREALRKHDVVCVHVEAPDETSHEGSLEKKIQAVEDFDKKIVGEILAMREEFGEIRIMVLPDHRTYVRTKTHASGPVPFAMSGPGVVADAGTSYCEKTAEASNKTVASGVALFDHLVKTGFPA